MVEEKVVLVDKNDQELGAMNKMEAHEKGVLHRAFSVFVFDNNDKLIMQRRALSKYHSPGLWANTCCSHPRKNEITKEAAHRRMKEEMGFDCEIQKAFDFVYNSDVGQGLTEHEFDHVFIGYFDDEPLINSDEVDSWKKMTLEEIEADMNENPDFYTVWFRIAFPRVKKFMNTKSR